MKGRVIGNYMLVCERSSCRFARKIRFDKLKSRVMLTSCCILSIISLKGVVMKTIDHRTQIYLTKEQYGYLRHQAEKKKASIAEVVRELIDERLPKEKDYKDNPLFSICKDGLSMGRPKGSVKHDEYIYRGKKQK